jgi:hypothetical protein
VGGPVVFISRSRVREGRLEEFREHFRRGLDVIKATKPHTVVFHAFLDEEDMEVEIVHVFPDAKAMDLHMEGAGERAKAAWEHMEPMGFRIYGTPSDRVLTMMRQMAKAQGIDLQLKAEHVGGFARLSPAPG